MTKSDAYRVEWAKRAPDRARRAKAKKGAAREQKARDWSIGRHR